MSISTVLKFNIYLTLNHSFTDLLFSALKFVFSLLEIL